jgi:low temperature requirement protein LtrA
MTRRSWWQRPSLRTDEDEGRERKASWLELFFDLVFVAVIAQLSHMLSTDISWQGLMRFVVLFIPVWWYWIGTTYYTDRFQTDDVSLKVFTFFQMLAVAGMTIFVHDALGESFRGFALSYVAARLILIIMWLRAGRHNAVVRPVASRYAVGFSLSVVLWTSSVFVPTPMRFFLPAAGLVIDMVTPLSTLPIHAKLPRFSSSHLPERFGLFIIIVLGESVIGVAAGAAKVHHITTTIALEIVLGLALAFAVWWLYFDFVTNRRAKNGIWWQAAWGYAHLPVLLGLTGNGAGVVAILATEEHDLSGPQRWLLCGAVAAVLFAIGIIELTLAPEEGEKLQVPARRLFQRIFRFGMSASALVLGLLGRRLSPPLVLAILLLLVSGQIVHGIILRGVSSLPQLQNSS